MLDYLIVALYLALTVGLGFYLSRKSATFEGFALGARKLPGWAIGLSILGTYLSSISFLANPGKTYADNWLPFVFSLTLPFACFIAARFFIPLYRARIQTTAYEHIEARFGYWARGYMGLSLILLQIGRIAVVLYLIALALSALLNMDVVPVILIVGIFTLIYTLVGGFEAVVWTDVIQSLVLLAGALICLLVLAFNLPQGITAALQSASAEGKLSFGSMDWDLAIKGFWVVFLFGLVENLRNFGVDQNYVQRFLSAESDKAAIRSLWIGGLTYIPVSALFFLIGTLLFVYFQSVPVDGLPNSADKVFPYFIVNNLPEGLSGILIAAVMAAGMSTLDSSMNSSATVFTVDFYRRLNKTDMTDEQQLKVAKRATFVIGITGIACAMLMINARSILDVWWQISAVFGGGMLGIFLLGLLIPNAGKTAAISGTAAGILVIAWANAGDRVAGLPGWPLEVLLAGLTGTATIIVVGGLASLVTRK